MTSRQPLPDGSSMTGRALLVAWFEVLLAVAATVCAGIEFGSAGWPAMGLLLLLAVTGLSATVALVLYAMTRAARPGLLRLCAYGCAASALIAFLAR
ncbi:hypothetical protein AB0M44_30955 [Streptosporangium subroseum]|uniref:hypothetical protein n=1 Tax=Streptosporangium subroseum TaxID=106412 RepID=UPI0034283ACA